jgi:hypothetical protein
MKNFTYCIQTMQTDFMGPFLAPSNYSNMVTTKSLEKTTETNNKLMDMFAYVRSAVTNTFTGVFGVFGGIAILLDIMKYKLKDMMNKLAGIYKTIFSILQAGSMTAESTWNALPGQLLRALPRK